MPAYAATIVLPCTCDGCVATGEQGGGVCRGSRACCRACSPVGREGAESSPVGRAGRQTGLSVIAPPALAGRPPAICQRRQGRAVDDFCGLDLFEAWSALS